MEQNGRRIQLDNYLEKNPPNAKRVFRPSRWGNPNTLEMIPDINENLSEYEKWLQAKLKQNPKFLDPIKGKDLICTCKLENRCHVDILLKYC